MKILSKEIMEWLKAELVGSGAGGFIFGLSGGVDSAVVGALVRRAVGERHQCFFLGCESSAEDARCADLTAKVLQLNYRQLSLDPVLQQLGQQAEPMTKSSADLQRARSNVKSRLRMVTLYFYANQLNYLVVGTGNKSEYLTGYFTKYGDGGCDLFPLLHITKTEVWALAKELGVPQEVIDRPPTAGLWPGQTDEGEMGITYKELDEIITAGYKNVSDSPALRVFEKLHVQSGHKREGARAFKS